MVGPGSITIAILEQSATHMGNDVVDGSIYFELLDRWRKINGVGSIKGFNWGMLRSGNVAM